MATLTQGQAARLNLKASQSITVTPSSAGQATVSANGPSNLVYEQKTIYSAETFGPYVADTVMNIAAVLGSLEYTDPYTLVPSFSTDSSGNVTGLVGPDGATIGYVLNLVSTAAAVSVTGTTTKTALRTIALPGGAMGANSRLIIKPIWGYTNSANNKVLTVDVGTTLGGATSIYSRTRTTTAAEMPLIEIANRNDVNAQLIGYAQTSSYTTANTIANTTATIAFGTTAMNIYVSGTLANTGETITLDSLQVDIVNPYQ